MAFTSVDLPAPLSPTSAVTSPGYTAKSTSRRTCTMPKLLLTLRSSRMGSVIGASEPRRAAHGGELARAHLVLGLAAVLEHDVHVGLGDRLWGQQNRRDVAIPLVVARLSWCVDRLALGQRDGRLRQGAGLLLRRLVDGHALRAGEHVLQPLDGRVLPADRYLSGPAVLLEDRDHRAGEAVVGGVDAVDATVGRGVHLLEDGDGLVVVPVWHRLLADDLHTRRLVDHRVRTGGEEGGVVVGGRTVEEHHVRRLARQAVDQALPLQ